MEKLLEGTNRKTRLVRPVTPRPAPDLIQEAILEEILSAAGLESLE